MTGKNRKIRLTSQGHAKKKNGGFGHQLPAEA